MLCCHPPNHTGHGCCPFTPRLYNLKTWCLRLLQHVETIQAPSSWKLLESKSWKDVTWEEKQFKEAPGRITAFIQKSEGVSDSCYKNGL
ncbi:hypothetical protein CsSME_00028308 [Camellia sinensis var. sinensis]